MHTGFNGVALTLMCSRCDTCLHAVRESMVAKVHALSSHPL